MEEGRRGGGEARGGERKRGEERRGIERGRKKVKTFLGKEAHKLENTEAQFPFLYGCRIQLLLHPFSDESAQAKK